MKTLEEYLQAFEGYPALPSEVRIENLRVSRADRIDDARETIAHSEDEYYSVRSRSATHRQKIFAHQFPDGRESTVMISKHDFDRMPNRNVFRSNSFHPQVGNAPVHRVPRDVKKAARRQIAKWEEENSGHGLFNRNKEGDGKRSIMYKSQAIIRYTVQTQYPVGFKSQMVLTEKAELTYVCEYQLGAGRPTFYLKEIEADPLSQKTRYVASWVRDENDTELVIEDGMLKLPIQGVDLWEREALPHPVAVEAPVEEPVLQDSFHMDPVMPQAMAAAALTVAPVVATAPAFVKDAAQPAAMQTSTYQAVVDQVQQQWQEQSKDSIPSFMQLQPANEESLTEELELAEELEETKNWEAAKVEEVIPGKPNAIPHPVVAPQSVSLHSTDMPQVQSHGLTLQEEDEYGMFNADGAIDTAERASALIAQTIEKLTQVELENNPF